MTDSLADETSAWLWPFIDLYRRSYTSVCFNHPVNTGGKYGKYDMYAEGKQAHVRTVNVTSGHN